MMKHACLWLLLPAWALAQEKPPVFEAKVDVVAVDVSVVDPTGKPVRGLRPEDFTITVDGKPRTVLSADFIDFESQDQPEPPPPSPHFSTNEGVRPGRLVLIAVDQGHISIGNGRAVMQAADRLLDQLNPTDRTGLVAFPAGVSVEFTAEHGRVREALGKVVGRARRISERLSISEALAWWEQMDQAREQEVKERECPTTMAERDLAECLTELEFESRQLANEFREKARASLNMLSSIFEGLKTMEGPKSLILVTEGMGLEDRNHLRSVAALASSARVSLYVLQLHSQLFADASHGRPSPTPTSAGEDEALLTSPLFDLASYTRGTVFRVTDAAEGVFERVANELSAYYLLGFDPEAKDRDGKDHGLKIEVAGRKATVRSRAKVNIPVAGVKRKDEEVLASLMRSPFPATDLPIRVATFAQRDRASGKVRVLVSAEISQVQGGGLVTGYVLADEKGKPVASGGQRLSEVRGAGPVPMLGSSVVDPGRYTLKLAAIDLSGRRGSVEHTVKAAVVEAGGLELGDLLVGPLPAKDSPLRPGVDPSSAGEPLRGHVEMFARDPALLKSASVTFEVAETVDGAAILTLPGAIADAPEGDRRAAQTSISTEVLPPGSYVARAVVAAGGKPVAALTQPFRVLPSARGGEPIPLAGLSSSIPRFNRAELLRPEVVGPFLDRMAALVPGPLPPVVAEATARARRGEADRVLEALGNAAPNDVRVAFLRGIGHLARGETAPAAAQLRSALRLSSTFMPATVYLGACYAVSGEDLQAAGAWQTALVSETQSAPLYTVLIDALLRANEPARAIDHAKEALRSWPADVGFETRLGLAQAMAGHRDEALAVLLPYVEAHPSDTGAVFVTLRLLFQAFTAGEKPEERDRLVRYARAYVDARGPNQEIVAHWLSYLNKAR